MARTQSATLTEAELRIMQVLWEKKSATVQQVLEALPQSKPLAYNSVLTTIRILEQKGYVEHRKEGRAFLYKPVVKEQEASISEVRLLMSRFFGNSREKLMLSLLGDGEVTAEELQRLKDAIQKAE